MDIICARTGRHLVNVEAARECSREHDHCNACPYDKKSNEPVIHFVSESVGAKARLDLDKLMTDINAHLKAKKAKPVQTKRSMSMDNREASHMEHPPACTCADCVAKRLKKQRKVEEQTSPGDSSVKRREKISSKPPTKTPKGCLAFLLIFALSMVGLGISLFIRNTIPLWLLVGASTIYSIEKWFSLTTKRARPLGKFYRFVLNLSLLSLLGLLIWTGIKVFSGNFLSSPLIGGCLLLAEFILFIWVWKVTARNSWRWPSMKLTVVSVIGIALVLAFAGVQPLAGYKDTLISEVGGLVERGEEMVVEVTSPSPSGSYTRTESLLSIPVGQRTVSFSKDTLTMETALGQKGVFRYRFVPIGDFLKTVSAVEATGIWMENVVTGEGTLTPFRYIVEEDIVVFGEAAYYK